MKPTRLTFFIIALSLCALSIYGQLPSPTQWKVTVHIVDEVGQPVQGADVAIIYHGQPAADGSARSEKKAGVTSPDGVFTASHSDDSWDLGIRVEKAGFYPTQVGHQLFIPGQFSAEVVAANRNPTLTLVLKKIGHPIPMYAQQWLDIRKPPLDNPIGFDLIAGDWVAPRGKGQSADIIFSKHFSGKAPFDYEYKLTVSFPNEGDGIQEFLRESALKDGSLLKSPYQAPLSGYQAELVKEERAHPGQQRKEPDNDPNRIYFFRVRTLLDEKGNVKAALYGKIYGDFMQFTYYLNPTPNDRNIEFDPKQNLLKGLESFQRVSAP
jgi:hypothetical protein